MKINGYGETSQERTSQITDMPSIVDKTISSKCDSLLKLPSYSGHLLITDNFCRTCRCPLFRDFTVLLKRKQRKVKKIQHTVFRGNYPTKHLVQYLEDRIKPERVAALRVSTGYQFFQKSC